MLKLTVLFGLVLLNFVSVTNAGPIASAGCAAVCGAAWGCCAFGAATALTVCPITAPFVTILLPMFSGGGCTAGYGACMSACGTLLIVPTP